MNTTAVTSPTVLIWEVSGTFVIPNTREKVTFGPVKVIGKSKQACSADLAEQLNQTFSKELRMVPSVAFSKPSFSKHFGLMHLTWRQLVAQPSKAEVQAKAIQAAVQAEMVQDSVG